MAKGLPVSEGSAKSERVIATSRWRLLELNVAKAEAHGPAGEYAGIVIGKPLTKPAAERKSPPKSPQPTSKRAPVSTSPGAAPTQRSPARDPVGPR